MARIKDDLESGRERVEGSLARLGNALVYLHLVSDRVQAAARIGGFEGMLAPALEECQQAARLIKAVQRDLGEPK